MANNRRFVVDFDLDDKGYRAKLDKLIQDSNKLNTSSGVGGGRMAEGTGFENRLASERMRAQEAQQRLNSKYSQAQIEASRRRVQEHGPYASQADQRIVNEANKVDQLNKTLDEANKVNRLRNFEESRRHSEYRSLSTQQLESQRRDLRKGATRDERAGNIDEADAKRRDVEAMSRIIQQRSGQSPEVKAITQLGKNLFLNQMVGGMLGSYGHSGAMVAGGVQAGTGAYSMMRMEGSSKGVAAATAIGASVVGMILQSARDAVAKENTLYEATSKIGDFATNKAGLENIATPTKTALEFSKEIMPFLQRTGYTGSAKDLPAQLIEEERLSKAMGLSAENQAGIHRAGGYGHNMMGATETSLTLAKFMESKGIANTKVGIGEGGVLDPNRQVNKVPEYLKKLLEVNEMIYQKTGERSRESNETAIGLFSSMLGLGGRFAREDVATETIGGIRGAFAAPKSPLDQYRKIQAYRQVNPGQDMTTMMEGLENMTDPKVINQTFNNLMREKFGTTDPEEIKKRKTEGGGAWYYSAMKEVGAEFGIEGIQKQREFSEAMLNERGGMTEEGMKKFFPKAGEVENLNKAADSQIGKAAEGLKKVEDLMSGLGNATLGLANAVSEATDRVVSDVKKLKALSGESGGEQTWRITKGILKRLAEGAGGVNG